LDHLSKLPLVPGTLKRMRVPAKLAGLGELQNFLQRGFQVFSAMVGTEEFVKIIVSRKVRLSRALFAGGDQLLGYPESSWAAG
jgi:hypothetical protein